MFTEVGVYQALHPYVTSDQGCLGFRRGDILIVYNRDPSGWWDGVCDNRRGWFPSEYV
ncbi:MAG: SH3 domain-containing protein, partial [Piptocephalis tieghemiana]